MSPRVGWAPSVLAVPGLAASSWDTHVWCLLPSSRRPSASPLVLGRLVPKPAPENTALPPTPRAARDGWILTNASAGSPRL